jgi:hypothetical protein
MHFCPERGAKTVCAVLDVRCMIRRGGRTLAHGSRERGRDWGLERSGRLFLRAPGVERGIVDVGDQRLGR